MSWWYIVSLCEISLQQILARPISRRDITKIVPISRWFIVLAFANPCDLLLIYQREIARTKHDIHRLSFALLLHSTVLGTLCLPSSWIWMIRADGLYSQPVSDNRPTYLIPRVSSAFNLAVRGILVRFLWTAGWQSITISGKTSENFGSQLGS